jgi:hypothetical protein
MSNRVKNADQTWVVYVHYDNDDVVYIGSGQVHRAFQFIKREENHAEWMVEKSLERLTADFCQIVFQTRDYEEARYVESRLIAEHNPKFNRTQSKLTFQDIKFVQDRMKQGESLRSCARSMGMAHDNLRIALAKPHSKTDYCVVV